MLLAALLSAILAALIDGILPFAQVGAAESCIELGQVTGIGSAVVVGNLGESGKAVLVALESLFEVFRREVLLTLCECGAGLVFAGL